MIVIIIVTMYWNYKISRYHNNRTHERESENKLRSRTSRRRQNRSSCVSHRGV